MSDKAMTLAQICAIATEPGEWIDGPFEVVIRNATARQGRIPSKSDVYDPNDPGVRAKMALFGGDLLRMEGDVVRFGGKGIKAKLYGGNVDISVGDKANIEIVGKAPGSATAAAPREPNLGATPASPSSAPAARRGPVMVAAEPAQFHREMKRIALLLAHCYQYEEDFETKIGKVLPIEQRVQATAYLFMTAKDRGLLEKPPALRTPSAKGGGYEAFVATVPDPAAVEAEIKRKAEEAQKAREEEERKRHAEQSADEDVPF